MQTPGFLWPPIVMDRPLYFAAVVSLFLLLVVFLLPILSGRKVDVRHTSTHGVALRPIHTAHVNGRRRPLTSVDARQRASK